MGTELPAEGFLRHKGLILTAAGGAVVEGGLLTLLAPNARSVAPQVTALPSLAAYHDLRWLFTDTQSWPWFLGLVTVVLAARAALDAVLLRLAWPGGVPAPRFGRSLLSCAALTVLAWLLLTPAATLAFGAAVVPFSWPFLAAFPIMLGIVTALSHGGAVTAWWRRLPSARAMLWLLGSFAVATVAAAVTSRLSTGGALVVTALVGLVNARAWYGLALVGARVQPRAHESVAGRLVFSLPFAPIAALTVIALFIGLARLLFTGAVELPISPPSGTTAATSLGDAMKAATSTGAATATAATATAVLVVGGWGSPCCDAANSLRGLLPRVPVRQFSYVGLDARGRPIPSGPSAEDLSLPVLGDRIAAQVRTLHAASGRPVAVVAESEGTLGVYAMLARDPGLPLSDVVLLSPIVDPGQLAYPQGRDGSSASEAALDELNHLVGGMSAYGPDGAENLFRSVSQVGASYYGDLLAAAGAAGDGVIRGAAGKAVRWLVVVPLADAVTLPECTLPAGVIVVSALHGGLLGDPAVLPMVSSFLSGRQVTDADDQLREEAELIASAATAWRMPDTSSTCQQ